MAATQEEGFKANRQKVQLVQQEVIYLGAMLGIEGQTCDKQSVELMQTLPSPTALPSEERCEAHLIVCRILF